jgi:hypothetical protein
MAVNLFPGHHDQRSYAPAAGPAEGQLGGDNTMSLYKVAVGLVAAMIGAAAVTALAGTNPDAKTEAVAAAAPVAQIDVPASTSACPEAPWPFGCQWREPVRRVHRSTRPL